jgi:5-methylcytosine-specific restriction endonuclease McrA
MRRNTLLFLWLYVPAKLRPQAICIALKRAAELKQLRVSHLAKESNCAACGATKNLHVHHIIPVEINSCRALDPTNLITLCSHPCHLVFGHLMAKNCYNPDVRKMTEAYRAKVKKRSCLEKLSNG